MVIWTDKAKKHITDFIDNARSGTENIAKKYIFKLVEYTYMLDKMKCLGTQLDKIHYVSNIGQLIYKSHRVIYIIENDEIYVLAVISTKIDFKNYIKDNLI